MQALPTLIARTIQIMRSHFSPELTGIIEGNIDNKSIIAIAENGYLTKEAMLFFIIVVSGYRMQYLIDNKYTYRNLVCNKK